MLINDPFIPKNLIKPFIDKVHIIIAHKLQIKTNLFLWNDINTELEKETTDNANDVNTVNGNKYI